MLKLFEEVGMSVISSVGFLIGLHNDVFVVEFWNRREGYTSKAEVK